ncbi:hypothetical protein [Natrialba aegyptia]|uniref:hypothetical protein n=1 Tax=Natrialba aegyptia TaxID=129789 RepID=UPI00403ADE79
MSLSDHELVEKHLEQNPGASVAEVSGATGVAPPQVADLIDEVDVQEADESAETVEPVSVSDHYDRVGDVYTELGSVDGGLFCLGNHDFVGWYRSRSGGGDWDGQGRPYALAKEWQALRHDTDRVVYSTVNYVPARWFMDAWDEYRWGDDGRVWKADDAPMPDYADIRAYTPIVDVDLEDDAKLDRPEGDAPREAIEGAIGGYIDAFADLAGDRKHVFALDSVGGAYVMVSPMSTAPIAEAFDASERDLLFDELTDRLNDWVEDVADRVTAEAGLEGVFEADRVNHKNRLYKAPLSVHKSLDGVVTPINTATPQYEFTPLADVDDDLVERTHHWARAFTDDRHRDAVGAIVETIWPDYHADAEDWEAALTDRLEDLTDEVERNRDRQQSQLPAGDIPDDLETTDSIDVIAAAVEGIDVAGLARKIADGVVERDTLRFDPSWRVSSTGESCIADRDKFYDLKEGGGGGALKLIALDRRHINVRSANQDVSGEDYWKAVNELRREGYQIPYFEGRNGTHPDVLRLFEDADDEEEKQRQTMRAIFSQ